MSKSIISHSYPHIKCLQHLTWYSLGSIYIILFVYLHYIDMYKERIMGFCYVLFGKFKWSLCFWDFSKTLCLYGQQTYIHTCYFHHIATYKFFHVSKNPSFTSQLSWISVSYSLHPSSTHFFSFYSLHITNLMLC